MSAPSLRLVPDVSPRQAVTSEDPALRPTSFDDFIGQTEVIANLRQSVRAAKRGGWQLDHMLFAGGAGLGKCLGEGTPVLFADGRVLPVEQVVVGDRLMGPDGKARTVLSTTSGRSLLYRIEPIKGEPWVCNDVHVLTLVHSETHEIVDVPLDQWLLKGRAFKHNHKQFSVGVDTFENAPGPNTRPIDPYFLGVWFGDGTKALVTRSTLGGTMIGTIAITKPDPEILALCIEQAHKWELRVHSYENEAKCVTHALVAEKSGDPTFGQPWRPNRLLQALRDLVGPEIRIPEVYLRGPREIRLKFLAGFLDTDGELVDKCFTVSQKREDWARGILWIARSLGLMATIRPRTASYKRKDGSYFTGTYWVVVISGDTDQIPTRLPRKQADPRLQKKVATRTGFAPIALGEGDYYGFTLDGDGRFLLGDFTVTHNTSLAGVIAAELGGKLRATSAPAIEHKGALASLLTTVEPGDVVFIDEIHAFKREIAECLYSAMEDGVIDLPAGKRVIRVPLPKFTLLGATTHAGKLPKPLLDRFGFVWQLRPYTLPEMETILARSAGKLGVAIDEEGVAVIARASRGTPRIANRLLRRVRDFVMGADQLGGLIARGPLSGPLAKAALAQLDIDHLGLDGLDRRYLAVVADRPVGVEAICAELGEDKSTIEGPVETWLMQAGLIKRGGNGRVATEAGRAHLTEVES